MKTILLADDSITIQKVVELTFSEADYRVICASTGAQALTKVAETRPDIILLDVIMPEKNGYEVCEHLKRSPATSGIPVLLLTGTFEPFDKKRADAAGAEGHITKPFESQALIAKVESLIAARPSVASDDEGGRMDIISGGEVYRVDPGRGGEGMRPAAVPGAEARDTQVPEETSADFAEAADDLPAIPPAGGPPVLEEESDRGSRTHPALAPPDPASGGSFIGFADVGLDAAMDEIVPDRFDEGPGSTAPSTVKVRRDSVVPRRDAPAADPATPRRGTLPGVAGGTSRESFEGDFEAEFDLVEPPADEATVDPGPPARVPETEGWTPPPEAPPAETWQAAEEPPEPAPRAAAVGVSPAREPRSASGGARPETRADGRNVPLTPEMIDLIAEKVVERLADRVVREVAWEVVPEVAEALVRKRIKELEESGS